MIDPDQVPLSTSEGRRPSSTAGDRMMVGLAALALIGGVLIAVSRVLPEQTEQTSQASATPIPSVAEASRTPRPTPSPRPPRTMTVDPAATPTPVETGEFVDEWVRVRTSVKLLSSPDATARPTDTIRRGQAVYVYKAPPREGGVDGWLQVQAPTTGWIFGEIDNDAMFERFPYRWRQTPYVDGLAANPSGFTASAWVSDAIGDVTLTSADGLHWQTSELPGNVWGRSVAYGPAGWLMSGNSYADTGPTTMLWLSSDGRSWQPLGTLSGQNGSDDARLVGTDAGYVLTATSGSGVPAVWFSADGQLWTERPMTFLARNGGMRVAATHLGFFLWSDNDPSDQADGAFSPDGWTWSEADFIGPGQVVDVVAHQDHLLALGRAGYGTRMWTGTLEGQQLTWSSDNTGPFRGAVVTRMVSDGERAIVLGWERDSETPLWWERAGLSWQRNPLPDAFGTLPHDAAGGPRGIVAIGRLASENGLTPVFWHLGAGTQWEPESSPVMPAPPPPRCGPLPDDLLEVAVLDTYRAADCFGDEPITVRGWSAPCEGCYGETAGTWETEWLAQPVDDRLLHLAPVASDDWASVEGVLHPSLRRAPPPSRWVEVTGHFDDPEAGSCRWTPTVVDEPWYSGTYDIVAGCRARFVVTAIRPVNGP